VNLNSPIELYTDEKHLYRLIVEQKMWTKGHSRGEQNVIDIVLQIKRPQDEKTRSSVLYFIVPDFVNGFYFNSFLDIRKELDNFVRIDSGFSVDMHTFMNHYRRHYL